MQIFRPRIVRLIISNCDDHKTDKEQSLYRGELYEGIDTAACAGIDGVMPSHGWIFILSPN